MSQIDDFLSGAPAPSGSAIDDFLAGKPAPRERRKRQDEGDGATALDYGRATTEALGEGILGTQAGIGTFLQAPAASALSGVMGARALADRGVTAALNWAAPGYKAEVNPQWQQAAQDAAAFAQEQRAANIDAEGGSWLNPRTAVARLGVGLQEDARTRIADIHQRAQTESPELLRQQQNVSEAEGFVDKAVALAQNPLATTYTLARSMPDMLIGLGLSKAAASRVMAGAAPAAQKAAAQVAASGGDLAAQQAAAQAVLQQAGRQAVARAGGTGMAAEAVSAGMQGREGAHAEVMALPEERLAQAPRYQALLTKLGDPAAARQALANEVADQVPVLSAGVTGMGSMVTRRLFGGDTTAKAVAGVERTTLRDVGRNILEEGTEEGLQGTPDELVQYGAGVQADPSRKLDLGGALAENLAAGGIMGGAGTGARYAQQNLGDLVRKDGAGQPPAPSERAPAPPAAPAGAQAVDAAEVLGAEPEQNDPLLAKPRQLTALDRVEAIDAELGAADLQEPRRAELEQERAQITADWPKAEPGAATSFSLESGAKIDARYALVEADGLVTSHDQDLAPNPAYPAELQPRDRTRAASEMQVAGIVQRLDPARLGLSADAATGAPIVGADGLVESGNARTIALKRVYAVDGAKADDYRAFLRDNAAQFGLDPAAVDAMARPVLVRVRSTPVNRAEFARQGNAAPVAAMSPLEQARSDSARIDSMDDLRPDDAGEFGASRDFIRRFVGRLPSTEQAGMVDASGQLSAAGYARVRNAVLAKAYGDSPVLTRMVEAMDDNSRNITRALMIAAPRVAQARGAIAEGRRFDADITPHLVEAAQEIGRLRDEGTSVSDALAQIGLMGDTYSPETRAMLQFLSDNARKPRRIADFIGAYFDALDAAGDPNQGSLLGDTQAPAKADLMAAAGRETGATNDTTSNPERGNAGEAAPGGAGDGRQPQDAPSNRGAGQGDGPAGSAAGNARGEGAANRRLTAPRLGPEAQRSLDVANGIVAEWQAALGGDVEVVLGGSLVSGLYVQNGNEPVDLDIRFLSDDPEALVPRVEAVTGMQLRKTIKVNDYPAGMSDAYMVEGEIERGGIRFELEGSVRNRAYVGWARFYPHVLSAEEIEKFKDDKKRLKSDKKAYKALKADMLARVQERVEEQGLIDKSRYARPTVNEANEMERAWAQAVAEFRDAAGDLIDIATKHQRAAMMPESTPDLMSTLVRLFSSAVKIVGTDIRRATAWVKNQLKADPETKPYWNKISGDTYRKAAIEAAAKQYDDAGGDLFSPVAAEAAAAQSDVFFANAPARETLRVDGQEHDIDAPHFSLQAWPKPLADNHPLLRLTSGLDVTPDGQPRAVLHDRIVGDHFKGAQPAQGRRPIAYVMGGGGASGKGTILKTLIARGVVSEKGAIHLDPDEIKGRIPEFDALKKAGDSRAAAVVHEESSQLSKRVLQRALEGKFDLIYDVTLGDRADGLKKLQALKDAGYEVRLFGVTVDPRAAVVRGDKRARGSGRYVPIPAMLAAHKGFTPAFEAYAELVDRAELIENTTEADRQIIAQKVDGTLTIVDPERYNMAVERSRNVDEQADTLRGVWRQGGVSGRAAQQPGAQVGRGPLERDRGGEPRGTRGARTQEARLGRRRDGEDADSLNQRGLFGDDHASNQDDRIQDAGNRTGPASKPGRKRKAQGGAAGGSRRTGGPGRVDVPGPANGRKVGRTGPDGVRPKDGDGAQHGDGGGPGRPGVPAGPDIGLKTGANYRFTAADLENAGSWVKRAERNVEAVELLKRLQAEGRRATREEQAALARFIGWGASDIANNLFGSRLDKAAGLSRSIDSALADMDRLGRDTLRKGGRWRGDSADPGYYTGAAALRDAKGETSIYGGYPDQITRAELEAARPSGDTKRWLALRDRLKAALTADEWADASRTTQYAHYTSGGVVRAMWAAARRFGFAGGLVLEPGAGTGIFPGLMPDDVAANTAYTGIEFDPITGGILQQLQPDERIAVESFVDSALPRDFYDLAIGNPPFSGSPILSDPDYKRHGFALHDYFFAKTLDRVRPGGMMMFVTSRYTMDKLGDKARKYLAERADLVGAIRLPQTAFKANAGTEVVTDVLFLRKRVPGETFAHAQPWLGVDKVIGADGMPLMVSGGKDKPDVPAMINEYFVAHPEMVLGKHANTGSMYADKEYTVSAPNGDIEALFNAAVERLPAGIMGPGASTAATAAKVRELDFDPKAKKEGNYYVTDAGVLMQREGGIGHRVELRSPKDMQVIKDFVPLRDALKQAQLDQLNGGNWQESLAALQRAYQAFVGAHGQVNQYTEKTTRAKVDEIGEDGEPTGRKVDDEVVRRSFPVLRLLADDPDVTVVAALENLNEDTGAITPSAFLQERVLGVKREAQATSAHDVLLTVLDDVGSVDMAEIARRLDVSEAEAVLALGSAVYRDPSKGWVTADEYLSGNVRRKLIEARAAAKADRSLERNVVALEGAQPQPKNPSQIDVRLGMNWIDGADYAAFVKHLAGVDLRVQWNDATKQWSVEALNQRQLNTTRATADWGAGGLDVSELLGYGLTGRPVRVNATVKENGTEKRVLDKVATAAAADKLEKMQQEFAQWIWSDADRASRLVTAYNDRFNTTVPRAFDGRHLKLPGVSAKTDVFAHVKRGAWRIVQTGNTYLAHAVGSGKTYQMVISAMEQKRLGLIKKPMMVVPNHMLQQFAREWQQLYPAARLMVADETNFHTDNRRRFVSRVALSDLDGVVITHSAFKLLDLDPAFKAKMIDEQLTYLRAALEQAEEAEEGSGKRKAPRVKQIEKQIEAMEEKLKAALSGVGKDKNVRFDELGVDMLYVDEAHEFRRLEFGTARQAKGIQPAGSARAFDLWMKTRWLEERNPGRSLVMASGTPVTNTLAELYNVIRFMKPRALEEQGLDDFDSWAAMFGREVAELEPNPAGGYENVTRFKKFVNVGELTRVFREFADVVTGTQLGALLGKMRPKVEGGARKMVLAPKTDVYKQFQRDLARRVEESRAWKPSEDEPNNPDPIIRIIGDGRLAAIDMRFINPALPNQPQSKLNLMIDDIVNAWRESKDQVYNGPDKVTPEPNKGSTMVVFSDIGFGEGVAEKRGFNARAWFEKRLRDAGVPPSQVAFMSDFKKSTDKLKLFKDVNAGRVRILVGSSKNMGTGVNAQQRLKYLFHLDSPWYPADLEQREGRIIRTGNKNEHVQIRAYATKGTYDENMWKMLASKQAFIEQALSGDDTVRELDDVSSVSQFDEIAGMISDDPRAKQLAGMRTDAERLERLYQAHERQRQEFRMQFAQAQDTIQFNEKALPKAEAAAARVPDLSGKNFVAKVGGKPYTERAEWGEALLSTYKDMLTHAAPSQDAGEIGGYKVRLVSTLSSGGYSARMDLDTPVPVTLVADGSESPVGLAMRAQNALADLTRAPARIREINAAASARMDSVRDRLTAAFPMAQMLADLRVEIGALAAQLAAESAKHDWWVAWKGADTDAIKRGQGFTVVAGTAESAVALAMDGRGGTVDDWDAVPAKPTEPASVAESEPTYGGRTMAEDLDGQEQMLRREAKSRGYAGVDDMVARAYDVFEKLTTKWREKHPIDWGPVVRARRQSYSAQRDLFATQLDLFANSKPVESQAGEGARAARAAAADALGVLRGSGTLLGKALAGGLAARQRASLVGQVAKKPEDLATLAQVYRDPRFETFRLFFTDIKGKIVAQVGLTSRLPGSTAVIVGGGNTESYVNTLSKAAKANGAKRVWMLHNHPSGIPAPSSADRWVTEELSAAFEKSDIKPMGHVVIDTNKYGFIEPGVAGRVSVLGVDFGAAEPFRGGGEYAGQSISGPDDVMTIARRLQVEPDAVTLITLNYQHTVHSITTLPLAALQKPPAGSSAAAIRAWIENARGVILRATLAGTGAKVVAVGRDRATIEGLQVNGLTLDSIHIGDRGEVTSMAARFGPGGSTLPVSRRTRVTADTSPQFEYLRAASLPKRPNAMAAEREAPAYAGGQGPSATERAEALIQTSASTPKPLDALARTLTRVTGIERGAALLYGLGARLIDRVTPETLKAGVVSDYGVPDAVIDQRATMQGAQRRQLREAGALLEKLAGLTRAESRVAYEWMTGEDPRSADELLADLPEDSVKVLQQVRQMVDDLSKEAVRLGQLDPEAHKRHRFAYLRRSYFKHAIDVTPGANARRQRAITILGDQYRGRGMTAKAAMRQIQNIAPEWWKRKVVDGKADTSLKGEKFVRLERRAASGEGTAPLEGIEGKKRPGKLLEVNYYPAGQSLPAKYADWDNAGTWEVRDVRGADLVMWRDFTKAEREKMGEIDEARFAIAKTLQGMIHDVEVGRYLEWLAKHYAKKEGEETPGEVVEASERYRDTFAPGTWVQVPDAKVPGTGVPKYGLLAGRYLPGPVWNDLRQVIAGRPKPLGEAFDVVLRAWKASKTALSPAVHMNNVMSNFVMADWHDVTAGHVAKALRIVLGASSRDGAGVLGRVGNAATRAGLADAEAAREVLARYQDSGGAIGGWITQEMAQEQLAPIVTALEAELAARQAAGATPTEAGVYAALQHALHGRFPAAVEAMRASRPAQVVGAEARALLDLYQAEDDVFRLAAWLKAKEQGMSDGDAGKVARRSFLDYSINAPWVAMMRATAWPFVSFSYRAIPMLLETAGRRPHKLLKLMALAGALNWLGVMIGGGGDDRERRLLPDEKAGRLWGLVPKLVRMPWNDANDSPVYLDVRRWVPVGDVLDLGQGHAALPVPPSLMPGGPLAVMGEVVLNRSAFTGKNITQETDTAAEAARKVADHLWKAATPNVLGVPGTYATQGVIDAAGGRTDAFGREMSVAQSIASSVGIKLGAYPEDVLRKNILGKMKAEEMEIDRNIGAAKRQRQTNRISAEELRDEVARQEEKKAALRREAAAKMQ